MSDVMAESYEDSQSDQEEAWSLEHYDEMWQAAYDRHVLEEDRYERGERWKQEDREREALWADNLVRWPNERLQAELEELQSRYFPRLSSRLFVRADVIARTSDTRCTLGYHTTTSDCQIVVDLCCRTHRWFKSSHPDQ